MVKLVEYSDRTEIHKLESSNGKFTLTETIPVKNVKAGLNWLKAKGYDNVGLVTMDDTDYEYKGGIVGLYVINDFLYSVILDFPEGVHSLIEHELGLTSAEPINIPYNKYLEEAGRLKLVPIA